MKQVIVPAFGSPDTLHIKTVEPICPKDNEVAIRLISVGLNQADLMARRGEYRLSSGEPPFTPGIEGGGIITAVGSHVAERKVGQRVILTIGAPYKVGTYRSEFVTTVENTVVVPDAIPDSLLGALWLSFATAWGALVWRQNLRPGQTLLLPAASSSVAIAASQIASAIGTTVIGTTTSREKVDALQTLPAAKYDHLVVTSAEDSGRDRAKDAEPWWQQIKKLTCGRGVDVIFDPVAAGDFLHHEIRLLAEGGTIWVYGLLGNVGPVDVSPLIRKHAAIKGWLLNALVDTPAEQEAYQHILENVAAGRYTMPIAKTFPIEQVREAHRAMEEGSHIGKYVLMPT